jgi:molecular chaperone HtpG
VAEAGADLIEDLVHQFSDPFAFYRELIQNSIDAGSSRIEVSLRYEPGAEGGLLRAQVADWGEGMTRGIIEQDLVTKFRSTKEGDLTKIGKFGIGFLSVFAPAPEVVVLETGRDGEDWRVLFHPDRSYELLRSPEPVEGTRVTLYKRMAPAEYREFAARSEEAVRRWCRHSTADVAFAAGADDGSPPPPQRAVREPLVADAPFQLEAADERTRIVAGPARRDPPDVGFYNRGLTLFETREALVPGISFKVVSDLLEHTLTRDNVLRDKSFSRVVARVEKLRGPLAARLPEELRAAAADPARGEDYLALLRTARSWLAAKDLVLPGAAGPLPFELLRRHAADLQAAVWGDPQGPVVRSLVAQGIPVLWGPEGQLHAILVAARELLEGPTHEAQRVFTLATVEAGPAGEGLCRETLTLLRALGARVARVLVGSVAGAGADRPAVLVREPGVAEPVARATSSPLERGAPPVLVLNRADPRVRDALAVSETRPRLAGYLCTRLLAVSHGALDAAADARLTAAALPP